MHDIDGAEHLTSLGPASDFYGVPGLPFTPAIRVRAAVEYVYVAGVLGPPTPGDSDDSVEAEARRVYANLERVLQEAGAQLSDIVSMTKYVQNIARDNAAISKATLEALPHLVTTTTVEIARFVPEGMRLEVSAVAAVAV